MLEIDNDLKDMIIQSLRYALYRHTYALNQTCEYIINNQRILDDRVRKVMLSDVTNRLQDSDLKDFEINDILRLKSVLESD